MGDEREPGDVDEDAPVVGFCRVDLDEACEERA